MVFSNSITLSDKLELDLQRDHFIELLSLQPKRLANEDLVELKTESKDEERPKEEVTEESKIHNVGNGKGIFSI